MALCQVPSLGSSSFARIARPIRLGRTIIILLCGLRKAMAIPAKGRHRTPIRGRNPREDCLEPSVRID